MTTATIRKKLINYISDADDKKVKGMYLLFEEEIAHQKEYILTQEQLKIVEEERAAHLNGNSKSYSRQEAKEIIRGKRKL